MQTNFLKNDVTISIHLDKVDDTTYGLYMFVNDELIMSSYGSEEWMTQKYASAIKNLEQVPTCRSILS